MDHALTIRLPDRVYLAAKKIAARQGVSMNRLVQEALADKAAQSVESRLRAAYDALADDPAEADVENVFAVQAEALLDD